MNRVAVRLDDVLADGETQAGPPFIPAPGGVGAVKTFKYAGQVFLINADPVVTYFYQHYLSIRIVHAGDNAPIILSIFNSILHEVKQYLPDLFFIGKNSNGTLASFFDMP